MILALVFSVLNLVSFNAHADLKFDPEVTAPLRAQILDDLKFMSTLQGSNATQYHKNIFGTLSGKTYQKWFYDRVDQVGFSKCGSDIAVACVLSAWENKMWMTDNYVKFSQPQIARLSIIYHEARHTEASERFWMHSKCPRPFKNDQGEDVRSIVTGALLAGELACDVLYNGSYGSQVILLYNIAQHCANCTAKVKEDALIFGQDQLIRIVNQTTKALMKKDLGLE
jgi:hypothetical protein